MIHDTRREGLGSSLVGPSVEIVSMNITCEKTIVDLITSGLIQLLRPNILHEDRRLGWYHSAIAFTIQ